MNDIVRTDIIRVFSDCVSMITSKDTTGLRDLSDHVIHNASIFQDEDSVSAAVIIYAVSKIFEKQGKIDSRVTNNLRKIADTLEKNNLIQYKENLVSIYKTISTIDAEMKDYVEEVVGKARIKKGSRVYEHGISMSQSAQVLGTSIWELMNFVGKTRISDNFSEKYDVKKRLTIARQIFGDKL